MHMLIDKIALKLENKHLITWLVPLIRYYMTCTIVFVTCWIEILVNFYLTAFQVLSKEDIETLNLCKRMMNRGEWPPLMVEYDPKEGYVYIK